MTTPTLTRWRLILGGKDDGTQVSLQGDQLKMDQTLEALYDGDRKGGLASSSPKVSRWLGDIRAYFPQTVVKIMQKDAIERLNLRSLLFEKEMLASLEPDVHLVATLLSLRGAIPDKTKDTARMVVKKLVDQLIAKLEGATQQAIRGALSRSISIRNPRHNEIDWNKTILKNLKNYQSAYKTIIPEVRYGFGRKRKNLKEIVLCIDQSGSMGASVVYSAIFGAVMASMPAISTRMVVFDTGVVDLTDELTDPVELLFGIQLGGGTDIDKALGYCQGVMPRPTDTIFVLVTDLFEGGNPDSMLKRIAQMVASGIQLIVLLALNDEGAPSFDHKNAQIISNMGVPVFACTPDLFPEMMAVAINKQDISYWSASKGLVLQS
ncbi:MAG: VWA domain-containing protein [Bacteroidia bacterium]|nr:VWA domain-containing protein [Bacteroidia bacterium]